MIAPQQRTERYQEGTLELISRKKGPDIWTYRWSERATGKRKRVRLGTVDELTTKHAVKVAADGYRLSANRENDSVRDITFSAVLDRYEREYISPSANLELGAIDAGRISSLTAKSYRSYIHRWIKPRWGDYLIATFNKPQVRSSLEKWLEDLIESEELAPKTVRNIGSLLKLIFTRAERWGYLEESPMRFVDLPKGSTRRKERPRTLTPSEFLKLLDLFEPRERLAVQIAGWLGTRRSEGFGLKWQDLDLEKGIVTFRQGFVAGRISRLKTEASRTDLGLPEELKLALIEWKAITPYNAPDDWVFASGVTNGARPMWPDSMLTDSIRPVAEKAGIGKIGWHTFRHSFVAWGKEVLKIDLTKELARQSDIATTSNIYGAVSLEAKRAAQDQIVDFVYQAAKKPPVKAAS